jgi:hypothetical protein
LSASPRQEKRPTSSRLFSFGAAAPWLAAALAAPLYFAFAWQASIATIDDDSMSYLLLARWFAGSAGPMLSPWVPWHTHFPPLFPMALALSGAAQDMLRAHLIVAAFAVASVVLMARYAARRLGSDWRGAGLAIAFLLLPTAWLGAKSILSETLFLALTLGALIVHQRWIEGRDAPVRPWLAFAALVALACSTRAAGVTLLAAYVACEAVAFWRTRRRPAPAALLPLLLALAGMAAWAALRPGGSLYAASLAFLAEQWLARPAMALSWTLDVFPRGWAATFLSEGDVALAMRACAYAVGLLALAGSIRAARANRLDGWYVLFTLALAIAWTFPFSVDNSRRLLYPVVPLMLLHAGELVGAVAARLEIRRRSLAVGAICALPFAVFAPATLLIAAKAGDRAPLVAGSPHGAAEFFDYYRVMNRGEARALAARQAANVGGLEALRTATPPGSRIMWMRPEYIGILGERACVPWYYAWDARQMAAHVRGDRADYIVVASLSKSDLARGFGDPSQAWEAARAYTQPVLVLDNPFTAAHEFILLRVDAAALDAYLAAR